MTLDAFFADLSQYFPAILAPALVAHLRRRFPAIDGWAVWVCVVLAAVAFSLVIGALYAQPPSLEMVRRGVLLGVLAAGAHTVATGKTKEKPPAPAPQPAPSLDPTPVVTTVRPKPDLDWDKSRP